jgi:hypothetical protein
MTTTNPITPRINRTADNAHDGLRSFDTINGNSNRRTNQNVSVADRLREECRSWKPLDVRGARYLRQHRVKDSGQAANRRRRAMGFEMRLSKMPMRLGRLGLAVAILILKFWVLARILAYGFSRRASKVPTDPE